MSIGVLGFVVWSHHMYTVGLDVDKLVFTEKILLCAGNFLINSPLILFMLGIIYLLLIKHAEQSAGNRSLVLSTKAPAYTNNTLKKFNKLFSFSVLYIYHKFLHSPLGLVGHLPKASLFVTIPLRSGIPEYDPYKGDFTKEKPTSSKGTLVRVDKESDHDLKKPDRKGDEYDPFRAETDSKADSVRNNPSMRKSNTESSLPNSTSHGTISEEEKKEKMLQASKHLQEYSKETVSTASEQYKKYIAERKEFSVFFILSNYRFTGFVPFISRLWSIIRTSLVVFEPFIPYFIPGLSAIISPCFAVVEPFIQGWRLFTKLKKWSNFFIIIYKHIINNRIKYTSYIHLKFRIIKSNYLYLILLVIIICICCFFIKDSWFQSVNNYACFCANIAVFNTNYEPSKDISKVSNRENKKTISKSYCGPCKDNTSRDKRENHRSIFDLNEKLKTSHSIVTTPNQELPFVSEHKPKPKNFLNDYDLGKCLSGLFEAKGSLSIVDFQITMSKKNIAFGYELKKSIGYGRVFSNEEYMFYKSGKGTLKFFTLIKDRLVNHNINLIMKKYFTDHSSTSNCDYIVNNNPYVCQGIIMPPTFNIHGSVNKSYNNSSIGYTDHGQSFNELDDLSSKDTLGINMSNTPVLLKEESDSFECRSIKEINYPISEPIGELSNRDMSQKLVLLKEKPDSLECRSEPIGELTNRDMSLLLQLNIQIFYNYWLAGFTQACGVFHTSVVKSKRAKLGYKVKLEYCLKHSNKGYLDYVYNNLSMGKVYWDFNSKIWVYNSSSFKLGGLLINYFDEFNVFQQKYVEYVKYRKVYLIVLNNKHLTKKGLNKIQSIANKGSSETSTH